MERLEQLRKSFYENGGNDAPEMARKIFEEKAEILSRPEFSACLSQYNPESKTIFISLSFGEVDYQIEIQGEMRGEWGANKNIVPFSVWVNQVFVGSSELDIEDLVRQIENDVNDRTRMY